MDTLHMEHPFPISQRNSFMKEFRSLLREKQVRRLCFLLGVVVTAIVMLLFVCSSSNSLGLSAYVYVLVFDVFCILTCLTSAWVQKQRRSLTFSFGYERFEVLAVFASTTVVQLGALFIVKESVERLLMQPEISSDGLLLACVLSFVTHMLAVYWTVGQPPFSHVNQASSTSWLQEQAADISQSLCHLVPGLTKMLLPRVNPFALIGFASAVALVIAQLLIEARRFYAADTLAATGVAIMICGTMFPLSVYSGKILLQTVPSYIVSQLDKCLREAQTLDGVLEFRNEHFWTLSFGNLAGSIQVRIRRDADEQLVLAHVYHRLSNLVSTLTVQTFKDDWLRPSAMHVIGDPTLMAKMSTSSAAALNSAFSSSQPQFFPGHNINMNGGMLGNIPSPPAAANGGYGVLSARTFVDPLVSQGDTSSFQTSSPLRWPSSVPSARQDMANAANMSASLPFSAQYASSPLAQSFTMPTANQSRQLAATQRLVTASNSSSNSLSGLGSLNNISLDDSTDHAVKHK